MFIKEGINRKTDHSERQKGEKGIIADLMKKKIRS